MVRQKYQMQIFLAAQSTRLPYRRFYSVSFTHKQPRSSLNSFHYQNFLSLRAFDRPIGQVEGRRWEERLEVCPPRKEVSLLFSVRQMLSNIFSTFGYSQEQKISSCFVPSWLSTNSSTDKQFSKLTKLSSVSRFTDEHHA